MTTNPILTAELNHQWYVMEKSRSGRLWILLAVVMLVPAVITAVVLFVRALTGMEVRGLAFATQPFDLLAGGQVVLLVMNIALSLVVMMVSFALATNSITREKRGKTWDNLILTNVSARKLVIGKWQASLKALDGDHIMIIILRIGLVAWIVAGFQDRLPADTASVQVHVLLLSLLVVLYSFIDMTFNTALGIGLMLSDLPGGITTALFFLFRGLGIMFVLWLFVQFVQRMYTLPGIAYFLPGLAGAVIYILITGLVLFVSQQIAVRNSLVSPSPRQ